jgi:hypothetical protein
MITRCDHCEKEIVVNTEFFHETTHIAWCSGCGIDDGHLLKAVGVPFSPSARRDLTHWWDGSNHGVDILKVRSIPKKLSKAG